MATYEFIIKKQGGGSSKSPVAGDEKSTDTEKGQEILVKNPDKVLKQIVSYSTVKSFATQIINHEVSMVELRTGSRELQERVNFHTQLVQQGLGLIEGAYIGFKVGGIVGAVVGTALSVTHTAIGYAQAQNRIDTQRTLENNSIQMNYIRAGARGSRGDT